MQLMIYSIIYTSNTSCSSLDSKKIDQNVDYCNLSYEEIALNYFVDSIIPNSDSLFVDFGGFQEYNFYSTGIVCNYTQMTNIEEFAITFDDSVYIAEERRFIHEPRNFHTISEHKWNLNLPEQIIELDYEKFKEIKDNSGLFVVTKNGIVSRFTVIVEIDLVWHHSNQQIIIKIYFDKMKNVVRYGAGHIVTDYKLPFMGCDLNIF